MGSQGDGDDKQKSPEGKPEKSSISMAPRHELEFEQEGTPREASYAGLGFLRFKINMRRRS